MNLRYIVGQQVCVAIRGLQELMTRFLFLPEQIALWNLTQIIVTVGTLFQFNVLAAVNIRVSQRLGSREDENQIGKSRSVALLLEVSQQLMVVFIIFLVGPHIWDTPANFNQIIFVSAAVIIFQTALINLFVGFHESSGKFERLAFLLPVNSIAQISLIYLGSYYGGLFGLFIGTISGFFVSMSILVFSLYHLNLLNYVRPDGLETKMIAKPAIYFKISDIGTALFYALDVILASLLLSPVNLALFMTAKMLAGLLSQSIFAINRMNLIKLGNDFGARKDRKDISTYLSIQFFITYLVLIPLIVIFSIPIMNFIFPLILPKYELSLAVLPFFLLCILCSPRALFLRNVWIQAMAWKYVFLSGVFASSIFLLVFVLGGKILNTSSPQDLGLIIFLGQLPYAGLIIISVAFYIAGIKQAVLWMTMFTASILEIILVLDIYGSINLFELAQKLTVAQQFILPLFLSMIVGFLSFWFLRKQENLSETETYLDTLKRALPKKAV